MPEINRITPLCPRRQHNILNPPGAGAHHNSLVGRATYPIGPYVTLFNWSKACGAGLRFLRFPWREPAPVFCTEPVSWLIDSALAVRIAVSRQPAESFSSALQVIA